MATFHITYAAIMALIMTSYNVYTEETCKTLDFVNGCSTPLWIPVPYKEAFRPSCNRHDVCYRCGTHYGWTQENCDAGLKRRMYEYCEHPTTQQQQNIDWTHIKEIVTKFMDGWKKATAHTSSLQEMIKLFHRGEEILKMMFEWSKLTGTKEKCEKGADIYYMAVRFFGEFAFMQKSPPHCLEKCAAVMGNPFH